MKTLADAAVHALVYLSIAPTAPPEEHADDDVRAVESLAALLRRSTPMEKIALQAAVARARARAGGTPDVSAILRTIETDLLGIGTE